MHACMNVCTLGPEGVFAEVEPEADRTCVDSSCRSCPRGSKYLKIEELGSTIHNTDGP